MKNGCVLVLLRETNTNMTDCDLLAKIWKNEGHLTKKKTTCVVCEPRHSFQFFFSVVFLPLNVARFFFFLY
jgi:hypothetical protein